MGLPMATSLLEEGFRVVGHNRSREPVEALVDRGGDGATTAREVAERAGTVVTCLPDTETVETVYLGEDGLLAGLEGGETCIDTSTISPTATEALAAELAERDVALLDAPVSGGEAGAKAGTLSIMVGGDADALSDQRPVLEAMGETITHCGPAGAGQLTKACNQLIVANTLEAISEALVFAAKGGADLEAVLEALDSGAAGSWLLENRAPEMIRGEFEPGFRASYQHKDLRIATAAADDLGAPLPITERTREQYETMEAEGLGGASNAGVIQLLERLADVEARVDD